MKADTREVKDVLAISMDSIKRKQSNLKDTVKEAPEAYVKAQGVVLSEHGTFSSCKSVYEALKAKRISAALYRLLDGTTHHYVITEEYLR